LGFLFLPRRNEPRKPGRLLFPMARYSAEDKADYSRSVLRIVPCIVSGNPIRYKGKHRQIAQSKAWFFPLRRKP